MSFRHLAVFVGGKYLLLKALATSSHVVSESLGCPCNQARALFLRENGNSLLLISSLLTRLIFTVSHNSKKFVKCWLESSDGSPPNCALSFINPIVDAFSLKWLTVSGDLTIADPYPSVVGFK